MKESAKIITLMYHRIDEVDTNPWGICVSPKHFDEQVELIKQRYPVITTNEAIRQVANGDIAQTSLCLTFDDGHADNYSHALPVLKKHDCLATFFIATAFTGNTIPFWWDELEMICLHSEQLPSLLQLFLHDHLYTFSFETSLTNTQWQQHRNWQWYEKPPTARCDSFLQLWNLLRPLPYKEIEVEMKKLRAWSNTNLYSRLPMNERQLQSLCSESLATLGLHTHTHADLSSQNKETQQEEIVRGKQLLFERYGVNSSVLAYPYGNFSETTLSVVEDITLQGCFTTQPHSITAHSKPFKLGRFQVGDWNVLRFEEKLLKWMNE